MEKIKRILLLIIIVSILMMCLYNKKQDNNKYNLISFTIDGMTSDISFPKKDSGYIVNSVLCKDGVVASWDEEKWQIKKMTKTNENIKCVVDFSMEK